MKIPYQELSEDAFHAILEEFATRDGTEFSDLHGKVAQLRSQVLAGGLHIFFDPVTGGCQLVRTQDLPPD